MPLRIVLNPIKEVNRLRKETNRLLGKGMSNIYLKVTIEKFSIFWVSKNLSQGQYMGGSNSHRYY